MADTATRQVIEMMAGYWASQSVYVAAKLNLPEHIEQGCVTVPELATVTGAHERSLGQLVRFLVGLEVLGQNGNRLSLKPPGRTLLKDAPDSLRDLVLLYGEEFYQAWGNLLHNVQTGQPAFEATFGVSMYPYFAANQESARRFDRTMSGGSFFADVPKVVDFSEAGSVVDVAGGNGSLLCEILAAEPHLTGVLFDVEHVITEAKSVIGDRGMADRVSFVAGNYTEAVPRDGDVYLLSRILHSRSDESCVDILRRCRESMVPGGRVVILERTIPPLGSTSLGLWFDVHMMVLVGGSERSEQEYAELLGCAGFGLESVRPLPLDMFALVATTVA